MTCLGVRIQMKRRQVLLHESWSIPKKDKSSVGVLTSDSGTARAVGQTSQCAVSNCGNEFEQSNSVSCRGSTLANNQRELASTSNESVIVASTANYSDKDGENSEVDIMPVDCTATDEGQLDCTCICCSNEMEAYQPKQMTIFLKR